MASLHIFVSLLVLSLFKLSEEKPLNQIAKRDATLELAHLGHSFGEANLGELVNNHRVKRSPKDDSEESEELMEGSADEFFRVKRSPAPQKNESSEESAESEESMEGSGNSSEEED